MGSVGTGQVGRRLASRWMEASDVSALLSAAAAGDQLAWNEIVSRFEGLVWSIARGYRLGAASTDDVVQTVWLRLAEHCRRIRQADRLAGWLATTTRNEALRVLRGQQRSEPVEDLDDYIADPGVDLDAGIIGLEETREVLCAFEVLDSDTRMFLRLVCADPPLDYKTISELSGRPIGSIGPTRARCLEKLRRELARQSRTRPGADE